MVYYQLVIAGFIALASQVIGAPIKSAKPFIIKGNGKNILVTGTAIGGDGGSNVAYTNGAAVPIVINGGYRGPGNIFAEAYQANSVSQSADGGSAIVAGVVARDIDDEGMEKRTYFPSAPVIKGNNKNVVVLGTAHGGDGGSNWAYTSGAAAPVVYTNGKGYTFVSAEQYNSVGQSANGGSAAVIGKSSKRSEIEQRTCAPAPPVVSHNKGNTQVQGVAIGGNGGYNFANTVGVAVPVVIGSGSATANQNNNVGQSANGGSAVVAGKYRRDIRFEVEEDGDDDDLFARKFTFPTFVDNKGNTVVVGSATGGNGGYNEAVTTGEAVPVVIASGNKWSSGYINVAAMQANSVGQSANGGSAAVVGKSS